MMAMTALLGRDSKVNENSEIPKPLVGDCEYVKKKEMVGRNGRSRRSLKVNNWYD
jgi:hypothetical protein